MAHTQTVSEFFHLHQRDGRAVVDGTDAKPRVWLTRVANDMGRVQYCLSYADRMGMRLLDGSVLMRDVTTG